MTRVRHHRFRENDAAIWNGGVQDIPVTVTCVGRDALGIYCRVTYQLANGGQATDRVHPAQLQPIPRTLS